jgi:hypothetical protein
MKRLLLLFVLAAGVSATAQKKLTEKDLLGRWTMSAMTMPTGTIDFKNETFIPGDEVKDEMSDEEVDEMGQVLIETLSYAAEYYVEFKKGYMMETNIEDAGESAYKLVERGGKQYFSDGEDEMQLYIKDAKLHFVIPDDEDGTEMLMIFEK